jgi:hypothetical protein
VSLDREAVRRNNKTSKGLNVPGNRKIFDEAMQTATNVAWEGKW